MGGDADRNAGRAQGLDLGQVGSDGRLVHPGDAAALVGDVKQDDRDPGVGRGLGRGEGLRGAEVVELPDSRVSRGQHLAVDLGVVRSHRCGSRPVGLLEHAVAPGPEVLSCGSAAESPLEGVAVAVHEAG